MAPSDSYQPNWHVRAITAPGPDTDLALHVSFDNARFLFGCGEGTQRAFTQKRLTMKGLSGIFLGSGETRSRGGLAGVLMTAADGSISKVDIVGPPDASHHLATLRSSVIRDSLTVNMRPYPRDAASGELVELFKSPNITVSGIALMPPPVAGPSTVPYDAYDPHSSSFRPCRLSPSDVQTWTNQIVCDIFHNGPKARASRRPSSPRGSPSRLANPFVNPDKTLCTSIPDTRYPLPVPTKADVDTQMVYICHTPDVRGKFDVEKANKLGVPKGPDRGKLTRGEPIEVSDPQVEGGKRIVKPEDCLVGGGPGSVLILINCSEENIQALLESTVFDRYRPAKSDSSGLDGRHVHLIVHRVPRSVWGSKEYQVWMAAFGEQTQHLIAETTLTSDRTVFNSAAWNTLQLSLLDPQIFVAPFVSDPDPAPASLPPNTSLLVEGSYCRMHPPSEVTTLPHHERDIPFTIKEAEAELARAQLRKDMPEYAQACELARAAVQADPRYTSPPARTPGDDIVVTTLGTGSAIPSKYRNVSSTHLDIPGLGGILLDAGEGTLGQMRRRLGKEGLRRLFEDLKVIFISHMHADHHLGLNAVLEDRFKHGVSSPLFVIAPPNIALTMQESASWQYHASQMALENVIFINIHRLGFKIANRGYTENGNGDADRAPSPERDHWEKELQEDGERGARRWPYSFAYGFSSGANRDHWRAVNKLLRDLNLKSIWAPLVPHRGRAYGVALEHSSGWKIVYSGDTKPSEALVEAGENATLLIHEATLEDDKPDVAAQKGHSTFTQAIDVGKKMKASHILLNHFSQRYPKLPKLPAPVPKEDGSIDEDQPTVSISFDFMSLRVGDMWKMSYYMDAMSMLFAEAEEEGEGEDTVLGAVKGDVNPSVDGSESNGVKGKRKGKKSQNQSQNQPQAGKGASKEMDEQDTINGHATPVGQNPDSEAKKGKRAMKKEAARAGKNKRVGSPIIVQPEAKRRSTESDSVAQVESNVDVDGDGEGGMKVD